MLVSILFGARRVSSSDTLIWRASLFPKLFGHRHAGWKTKHHCHYRASLDFRIGAICGLCVVQTTASITILQFLKKYSKTEIHSWLRSPALDETMSDRWEDSRRGHTSGPTVRSGSTPEFLTPESKQDFPLWQATASLQNSRQGMEGSCDSSKARDGPQWRLSCDEALMQDDGIDLNRRRIRPMLGGHARPRQGVQDRDGSLRDPEGPQDGNYLSCLPSHGENSTFNSWKTRWGFHWQR